MSEPSDIVAERMGARTVRHRSDVPLEAVLAALADRGEVLKASHKSLTRRVGSWVIKESRRSAASVLKHALCPARCRRAWRASWRLRACGVGVPEPRALVETRVMGVVIGDAMIADYLVGHVDVERFARELVARGAERGEIDGFLDGLAAAVNGLNACGVYHADLSGKNIYTPDGRSFRFIDLDGVVLDRPYADAERLRNHVQLYDSFCDLWGPETLAPFIQRMLPPDRDAGQWVAEVRAGQAARRARIERVWRKQGRA